MNRSTKPTHVYFNVRVQNGNTDGADKICEYREQRVVPIVNNPSEYYLSCIRFNIPTSRIPILIVPVQPFPNTDPTKTIYSVGLSYGAADAQTFVAWSPNETAAGLAITPKQGLSAGTPFTDSNDSYYYCRSYVHMMSLVNKAFATAFADLSGQLAGALPAGAAAPFFTYDSVAKLFTLHAPASAYDTSAAGSVIKIYMNNDLFTLFGAFDSIKDKQATKEKDVQVLIARAPDGSNVDASGIIHFVQEYTTLVAWVGFQSLVITSGTIPVESEGIPTALPYFSNTNQQSNGQPTFLNIVSDYDALLDVGYQDFQVSMQYSPPGEYRFIELTGTQPLTSFDIQALWTDVFGGLHPVLLGPNESATFKFMFRRRNFNGPFE